MHAQLEPSVQVQEPILEETNDVTYKFCLTTHLPWPEMEEPRLTSPPTYVSRWTFMMGGTTALAKSRPKWGYSELT